MSVHRRVLREGIVSALCFLVLVAALVGIDPRVRDHMTGWLSSNRGEWTARAGELATVMLGALRDQSLNHAPLLVFAGVAAALVLAMLRS